MKLGMIGLGRMGSNMVRRLLGAGQQCVVFGIHPQASVDLAKADAVPARSLGELPPLLAPDDVVIDGGNSYYHDDIRRAEALLEKGIHYVDVGTSGGVWGVERGYCQMIGGEPAIVQRLDGIFAALALELRSALRFQFGGHKEKQA